MKSHDRKSAKNLLKSINYSKPTNFLGDFSKEKFDPVERKGDSPREAEMKLGLNFDSLVFGSEMEPQLQGGQVVQQGPL